MEHTTINKYMNFRFYFTCHHKLFNVITLLMIIASTSCAQGDDQAVLKLIHKHLSDNNIKTTADTNGLKRISSLSFPNNKETHTILPHLDKLDCLVAIRIGGDSLNNNDIKLLPPLPKLKLLVLDQSNIDDNALKYLIPMKNLRRLSLRGTNIKGPGLAYLKGFDKLEWLQLGRTPLGDNGIPHIIENFPKLKRLDLERTKITSKGVMELSNLLWLTTYSFPDDIANPGHKVVMSERLALLIKYQKAHLAAIQKARAEGREAPSLNAEEGLIEHIDSMQRTYLERLKIEERRKQD